MENPNEKKCSYGNADKWAMSADELPLVDTPATKQTSAPETESWNNFKSQFDYLWRIQTEGSYGDNYIARIHNYGSGIGLLGPGLSSGYVWTLDYIGDSWRLTIKVNPHELSWCAIRNSLRNVSPDGGALYNEFYKQFYEDNPTFPEYDMWVNIGGSQAMAADATVSDYVYFYFK